MKSRLVMLENGTRDEACCIFDAARRGIKDFKHESVSMIGNIRNPREGWSVVKTKF